MKKILLISLALVASLQAAYSPRNANGQATMANSAPVVIASDQSALTVNNVADLYLTGQSAQTATINNIIPSTAASTATDVTGYKSGAIQVVSTGTAGTFIFEGSNDNTNFVTIPVYNVALVTGVPITAAITASSSQIVYAFPVQVRYVRLRIATTITGGSIQAFSSFKNTPFSNSVVSVVNPTAANLNATVASTTDTKHPTAAAVADATTNPTETQIGANKMQFNGTTWDRERNNWNTTTGDTGAKTTTFNGATQVNYSARGAYIWVNVGTVSGTTPTMAVQLQVSYDTGTTWMNLGPAQANLTTSSTSDLFIIYPANISQAAGTTPVNITSGATNTVAINSPLPRSWRLVYTIGGTTPSFTITNVQVSYIN